MFSDVDKLMYGRHSAQDSKIIDNDFSGQLAGIRNDAVVANQTVMSDMRVGHNQTVVAYLGYSFGSRTPVHGSTLPDGRVIPDFYNGFFTSELQILRYC